MTHDETNNDPRPNEPRISGTAFVAVTVALFLIAVLWIGWSLYSAKGSQRLRIDADHQHRRTRRRG